MERGGRESGEGGCLASSRGGFKFVLEVSLPDVGLNSGWTGIIRFSKQRASTVVAILSGP